MKTSVTIERKISAPKEPKIVPSTPEVLAAVEKIGSHPEFALSRREILKYVLTEPGERSREVQALLKLDEVDSLRAGLQSLANSLKTETKKKEEEVVSAKRNLLSALDIEELKAEKILTAANDRRDILGLSPQFHSLNL